MKKKIPKTPVSMTRIWIVLMGLSHEDKEKCKRISAAFNDMLDELLEEDFFGTEGQLDPRGDHRG